MVPASCFKSIPLFLATATYNANRIKEVALMVMEVLILSKGIPSNKISISSIEQIETPTLPTSPSAKAWSAS